MTAPIYDLKRENYVLSSPLEAVRFQRTTLNFMGAVRNNAFRGANGVPLMDEFCTFISSKHVWRLAQNVVPEFRWAPRPSVEGDASKTCLDYILRRSKLPFLPAARDDKNVLTSEEKMLRDRHTTYVEYLVTGGKGKDAASQSDRAEIENLSQQVNDIQVIVRQYAEGQGAENIARQEGAGEQDIENAMRQQGADNV